MGIFKDIDNLLRGKTLSQEGLKEGRIQIPLSNLIIAAVLMGAIYGVCMGVFSAAHHKPAEFNQIWASAIKVPLLFCFTLMITFPSLYVFSALAGSRLGFVDTIKLLVGCIAVNLAILASFGLITVFFTFSTESYPFMITLNTFFFTLSGIISLGFLWKVLIKVFLNPAFPPVLNPEKENEDSEGKRIIPPPIVESQNGKATSVFYIWMLIYGIIGAQMGWLLRPFIGKPESEFSFFRAKESNFFEAIFKTLQTLLES